MKIFNGSGEDLGLFMTNIIQKYLTIICQNEFISCFQFIKEMNKDEGKAMAAMKDFLLNSLKGNLGSGDCVMMSNFLLEEFKKESKERKVENVKLSDSKKQIEFDEDIFYLCECNILNSQDDHIAICAEFQSSLDAG